MNEYEISDRLTQYQGHPILGPATRTLHNLLRWTQGHSDGWAYWPKPSHAARQLIQLIEGEGKHRYWLDDDREDVTEGAYKKALVPIKAFRTRQGADFYIEEIGAGPEPAPPPTPYERELKQLLVDWIDRSLSVISEFGGSHDWPALIEDAERRAQVLGIKWSREEMPDYVKQLMAIDDNS
jgi:hypothetical protein